MNFFKISLSAIVIFLMFIVFFRVFLITPVSVMVGQGLRGGFYGLAGMTIIVGIINLVAIVGIRYLKRWGLILFTVLTALDIVVTTYNIMDYNQYITIGIYLLILAFFWGNYKKFN